MLATGGDLPTGPGWAYELKWDGVRALAVITQGRTALRLFARSGAEITAGYPELAPLASALRATDIDDAVLDGEIVALGEDGRPNFMALAERMHVREAGRTAGLATTVPVTYMIFDLLRLNGAALLGVPYRERRELLEALADGPPLGGSTRWLVPPRFDDGPATLTAAQDLALEGVVAKRLDSAYRPGLRTPDWIKVKHEHTGDFVVGGWRPGSRALGALLVGRARPDGALDYRGRVGGGISASAEKALLAALKPLHTTASPFAGALPREDAKDATYVRPELVVEVRYGQLTPDAKLRFPRFVRLRPDKSPAETEDQ
jgi:bifunctional non-homologous end joining protein LigD